MLATGILVVLLVSHGGASPLQGPVFLQEPPHAVHFSNDTGALVPCSAHGNPTPVIRWQTWEGAEAGPVPGVRHPLGNGSLLLPAFPAPLFAPGVHRAAYRCVARNSAGAAVSRRVVVHAVLSGQQVAAQVHDEFVVSGNTAVLRCHVPAFSRESVAVAGWLRGEPPRDVIPDIAAGGRFSVLPWGELHVRAASERDAAAGPYRCRTTDRVSGRDVLSAPGRLVLTEARGTMAPRLIATRSHVTARAHQPVELPCAAQALPPPHYTWFRAGDPPSPVVVAERMRQAGGSLYFRRVSLEDAGRYTCLVNNSAGHQKVVTTLLVTAPLSSRLSPQVQTVSAGQPAIFNCSTEGFPQKAVLWLKDAHHLLPSSRIRISAGNKTLRIPRVEQSDAGMYQCIVYNDEESAQATAQLNIGGSAPVLLRTFPAATVRPGAAWSAACEAAGSPRPEVTWQLDGAPLPAALALVQAVAAPAGGALVSQLRVARAGPEHAGLYRCRAANAAGAAEHAAALRLLGPPHVKPMQDRRVAAGRDAAFPCRVAGFPISSIQWLRNGKVLPQSHRQLVFPNGTLIIRDTRKEDDGGYFCVASNPDGLTSRSKLVVQVMEPPSIDPFSTKKDPQKGTRVHLHCVVNKGDPPIVFRWLKDGESIPHGLSVIERTIDEYSSTLTINRVMEDHTGNYTCVAENAVANTSHTTQLTVNVPPSWLHEPADVSVLMGESVIVPCDADGSPKPTILWKRESDRPQSLYEDNSFQTNNFKVLHNGSLWIQNVLPEDRGYYTCEARNEIGMALNKVIYITVHVPARLSSTLQNVTAVKGGTAAIDCVARGDKPISIKWFHGGTPFETHTHPRAEISEESLEFGSHSRITLKNVLRSDTSAYTCFAKNQYGSDESDIWVIVQEVPEAPANVHVHNYTSRAVNLAWEQPYDGNSPITVYTVQYKKKSGQWEEKVSQITVPGDQLFATISGLQPARSYHFRIVARNTVGPSNASDATIVTTAEEPPEGPPQEVSVRASGSQSLSVTWKEPIAELQHGEIIGYYIGYRMSNSTGPFQYKTYEVTPNVEIKTVISGLRKFAQYVIFAQAYNSAGAGPQSAEVLVFTDEDVPDSPPGDVQCTSISSQSILLTWLEIDVNNVNGVLLGYKVTYRAVSEWDEASSQSESSTEDCKMELTGLQKYCNYSMEVRAYTRVGDGVSSRPVFCRTQEDVPAKLGDIKALVANAKTLLISWKKPKYSNGIIKRYNLYMRSLDGAHLLKEEYEIPPSQTHYFVSHLVPHHRYEFWVTAATVVGESQPSSHVIQAPSEQVPAKIASFGDHVVGARGEELALPCLAVGLPQPTIMWRKGGKNIQETGQIRINTEWTLHMMTLQTTDAGNYSCRVENLLGTDEITYSLAVKTPLAPADFKVSSATETSMLLQWTTPTNSIYVPEGYSLHFKREFGEWEKMILHAGDNHFNLENLQCGSKYQLYIQAFNQAGHSNPTDTLYAYSQGKAPIAPTKEDFLVINSTFIHLNVKTWDTGGCPITTLVVEYKLKSDKKWTLVTNNLKYTEEKFSILDLNPETEYQLRITAHNSAGSTVALYDFITSFTAGEIVQPELIRHRGYRSKNFYKDLGAIIPITVVALTGVICGIGMFLYFRRRKQNNAGVKCEGMNVHDANATPENKGDYLSSDISLDQKPGHSSVVPEISAKVNPYATFRLTNEEKMDSLMPDYERCSEYMKIKKKVESETEGVDWIPLHSLYQAHRY